MNEQPAFPVTMPPGEHYKGHTEFDGMTLRDYFAAKALNGILSSDGLSWLKVHTDHYDTSKKLAEFSYSLADAMLEQHNK